MRSVVFTIYPSLLGLKYGVKELGKCSPLKWIAHGYVIRNRRILKQPAQHRDKGFRPWKDYGLLVRCKLSLAFQLTSKYIFSHLYLGMEVKALVEERIW
jgi:hypothetical protein